MIKFSFWSSAVLLLLAVSLSAPAFGQCTPRGQVLVGGNRFYDYIANGGPTSTSCWSLVNVDYVSGIYACGPFSPDTPSFSFRYASSATQSFTIPTSNTLTSFWFGYEYDFIDPHQDGFNQLDAYVTDLTTGQTLVQNHRYGNQGSASCTQFSTSFSGSLAGHTLQVRFTGNKGYSDTYIRVRNITLSQQIF